MGSTTVSGIPFRFPVPILIRDSILFNFAFLQSPPLSSLRAHTHKFYSPPGQLSSCKSTFYYVMYTQHEIFCQCALKLSLFLFWTHTKHLDVHHIDKISVLVTFQRRVGAMRNLQLERKTLESQFYIDLLGIESKYWSQLREPLYRQVWPMNIILFLIALCKKSFLFHSSRELLRLCLRVPLLVIN